MFRADGTIPDRYKAKCEFCGYELDTREAGVHQYTSGWVMNRAGGGGHGISVPERANRWAHRQCVERVARGQLGQGSMFD